MIISPDKNGHLDAPTYNLLKEISIDVPIVLMCGWDNYEFDKRLYDLGEYVLCDFSELGANSWALDQTMLWGKNADYFRQPKNPEWQKFDDFVKQHPPNLYFKRELLNEDRVANVHPINFPCIHPKYEVQSKVEFENRPIDLFNSWGYSHELRRVFHGEVFLNAVKRNRAVIDNFSHLEQEIKDKRKKWVSVFTPWHSRLPMDYVLNVQGASKLSISLPGAGVHCFRHAESPVNSVMVMRDDPIAYSFEWQHNINCIKFPVGKDMDSIRGLKGASEAIEAIETALENPDLYDIYKAGMDNCDKYRVERYCKEYLEPLIKRYM